MRAAEVSNEPRKDGVDRGWPRVEAEGWQEAVELGKTVTEPTTFEWSNGCAHFSVTMGFCDDEGRPLVIEIGGR